MLLPSLRKVRVPVPPIEVLVKFNSTNAAALDVVMAASVVRSIGFGIGAEPGTRVAVVLNPPPDKCIVPVPSPIVPLPVT